MCAIMYPEDIENYNATASEKEMYYALRDQLPENYYVFYSVRWFDLVDEQRIDSECDFIIFAPTMGFLSIEVKGGERLQRDGDDWLLFEKKDNGEIVCRRLKCSPYLQAEKSMRHFYKRFREEYNQNFYGAYGFAVAFPRYSSDTIISSGCPRELTIDMNDMKGLCSKVNSIFHYWKDMGKMNLPSTVEQRQFFLNMIHKRVSLAAASGALIPIREREFKTINMIQDGILDAVTNYHFIRFVGGAGTGKTFIGAKKAIRDSENGMRTLFTCKSESLANYVKERLFEQHPDIICLAFNQLIQKVLADKYDDFVNARENTSDFIKNIPEEEKYDTIIVDEAQDYDEDMGVMTRAFLKNGNVNFYAFYDKNQDVFSIEQSNVFSIELPPFVLRYNIRNTGKIYENAIAETNVGRETIANSLLGVEPEKQTFKQKWQALNYLTRIVNQLTNEEYVSPKSIIILSNKKYQDSLLKDEEYIGHLKISTDPIWVKCDDETIHFSTISDFKGLESDVVIYINHITTLDSFDQIQKCRQYVALTRARYYLYEINIFEDNNHNSMF